MHSAFAHLISLDMSTQTFDEMDTKHFPQVESCILPALDNENKYIMTVINYLLLESDGILKTIGITKQTYSQSATSE